MQSLKSAPKPVWVRPRERQEIRGVLLDAARALIARCGEKALTLSAVAAQAGLARATIYGHFSGKDELLAALDPELAAAQPQSLTVHDDRPAQEPDDVQTESLWAESVLTIPAWIECQPDDAIDPQSAATEEPQATTPEAEAESVGADGGGASVTEDEPDNAAMPDVDRAPNAADGADNIAQAAAEEAALEVTGEGASMPADPQPASGGVRNPDATEAPAVPVPVDDPATHAGQDSTPPPPDVEARVGDETDEESEDLTPYDQKRHLQAAHLEEIAKRLILPESALKEGTDAVIARLDTRIRVLERTIANLESNQSALAAAGEKQLKPVAARVDQIQARVDTADNRQLKALADLRLSVHELSERVNVVDPSHRESVGTVVWPEPAADVAPSEDGTEPARDENAAVASSSADKSRHAYLSNARNLAMEGWRLASERDSQMELEQSARRRRLVTAAAVMALCLAVVAVLFKFHPGPQGVSVAQSKPGAPPASVLARQEPRTPPAKIDMRGPLDRLTALANQGNTKAELVVGLKYLNGDGEAANPGEAARWFGRAAQKNDAVAENYFGSLYQNGRGVKVDLAAAMRWYEAAAIQGNRHAMSNLAVLYAAGSGPRKDFAEAARWFLRSASLGFVDAQFNLAVLFERGDGVPQSLLDAYKWYAIAAQSGDAVAKARADAIATQISPDELEAAQGAVAGFESQPMIAAANDVPSVEGVLAAR